MLKFVTSCIAGVALALGAFVPAFAGSNGQQIQLFNSVSNTVYVCVAGYNQNMVWVRPCWWLWNTGQGDHNDLAGYWYKYTLTIDRTDSSGTVLATRSDCYVPVSQTPDWYACLAP
jgi:hypothetical protein